VCLSLNRETLVCDTPVNGVVTYNLTPIPEGTYEVLAYVPSPPQSGDGAIALSSPFTVTIASSCTSTASFKRKVVDGFTFYNEAALLKLRLDTLWDAVDLFVLVESDRTFTGAPKQLHWSDVLRHDPKFAKYLSKIQVHVITSSAHPTFTAWDREYAQRDGISTAALSLPQLSPEDLVIVSDVDEIPRPEVLQTLAQCAITADVTTLEADMYYYNFHWKKAAQWPGVQVVKRRVLENYDATTVRRILGLGGGERTGEAAPPTMATFLAHPPQSLALLPDAAWHFSYFLNTEQDFIDKLNSFSHQEFNTDAIKSTIVRNLNDVRKRGKDLFGRSGGDDMVYHPYQKQTSPKVLPDTATLENYGDWFVLEDDAVVGGNGGFCAVSGDIVEQEGAAVVIGIVSGVPNRSRRDAIRSTWLQQPSVKNSLTQHNVRVEYVFLLGKLEDDSVPLDIREEILLHNDILIVDVHDTYGNMIHKVMHLFDWAVKSCGATYVIRANDDVYLRLSVVLDSLLAQLPSKLYAGWFLDPSEVIVLRSDEFGTERSSLISYSTYPSSTYPVFAQGNAYILSSDIALKVGEWKSQPWRRLFADDIMVGLLCDNVGARKQLITSDFQIDNNLYGEEFVCREETLFHFDIGEDDMLRFWENYAKGRTNCYGFKSVR
jgi:beta-1,4-mannosyl-glycoprotein beta-1,4-N-acetylglucosaminyltransferase